MTKLEKRSVSKAQRVQCLKYLISSFKAFRRDMAPDRVRLDRCRLLRRHVLGHELPRHRTEDLSSSGVLVHREEGVSGPLTKGVEGMAEAEATPKSPPAQTTMARGHREMGLKLVLDFDLYLRPSEVMDLLRKHVVAPVPGAGAQYKKYSVIIWDQEYGKPDKTGVFDKTLLLNSAATQRWLGPALYSLAIKRGKDHPLFS